MTPIRQPEAARLYQQILPVARDDEQHGDAAAHLCAVLMAPIERIVKVATEVGKRPGYGRMLNVDEADVEDLRWLGLLNGTALSGLEAEEEQRRLIREARGSHRGRVSAIISDVKATLTGTKSVTVLERDGASPFENLVVTGASQTPNPTATLAALANRQTKPLGAVYTPIHPDSILIDELPGLVDEQAPLIDGYSEVPS
jgi:hypothetical protein